MKHRIKALYQHLRFLLSVRNHYLLIGFYKYLYRPSKGSIAHFLDDYSRKTSDFTVIQIGANDGITNDPIHKFIKRDSWQGVLLEPQQYVFEKYLKPIYSKNEGIIPLRAALGYKNGTQTLYKIGFSQERWATGLATFNRNVLENAFSSGHVTRQLEKQDLHIPLDKALHITEEEVPVIDVKTLLATYSIKKVDLLQIDAEGFDFEIIKMFDLSLFKPRVIIFEHSHLCSADLNACFKYLTDNAYTHRQIGGNTLAILSS